MTLSDKDLMKLSQILSELLTENDKGNNFDSVIVPIDTFKTKFSEFEGIKFYESILVPKGGVFLVNSKSYLY